MPEANEKVVEDAPEDFTEVGETPVVPPQKTDDSGKALIELLADPQVAAILAARKAGEPVEVVRTRANEPVESEPIMNAEELEDLDPDVRKVMDALTKHITSSIEPLREKVGALENIASTYQQNIVGQQIKTVESQHKDFDKYRPAMAELSRNEGAGLGVEELYLIAKSRAGDLTLTNPSTDSEKPTPTPRRKGIGPRRDNNRDNSQSLSSGRAFKMSLADALDRSIGNR